MFTNLKKTAVATTLGLCLVGGLAIAPSLVSADDNMAMQRREAAKASTAKMKMMMKDPSSMPGITASMAKMTAIEEMAADLAKDTECKEMCEKMMMTDAGKMAMTASPEAVAAAKEQVMNDPEAMKMVAAKMMMMGHGDMKMMNDGMKSMDGGMKPMGGEMKK